jgi:hypothetical protein
MTGRLFHTASNVPSTTLISGQEMGGNSLPFHTAAIQSVTIWRTADGSNCSGSKGHELGSACTKRHFRTIPIRAIVASMTLLHEEHLPRRTLRRTTPLHGAVACATTRPENGRDILNVLYCPFSDGTPISFKPASSVRASARSSTA